MNNKKRLIIGFDPGLINTGWGVLEKNNKSENYIDHGCITTSNKDKLGMRLKIIYEESLYLLKKYFLIQLLLRKFLQIKILNLQ